MRRHSWTDNICTICNCRKTTEYKNGRNLNIYVRGGEKFRKMPECWLYNYKNKPKIEIQTITEFVKLLQKLSESEIKIILKISDKREVFEIADKLPDPEIEKVLLNSAKKIKFYELNESNE